VIKRNGFSRETVEKVLEIQGDDSTRLHLANYVIDTQYSKEITKNYIISSINWILNRSFDIKNIDEIYKY
jgi:dephospho-CoA kinase